MHHKGKHGRFWILRKLLQSLPILMLAGSYVTTQAAVIEEIIVTAQKREQAAIDVPLSVSAFTGEKISDSGINNLADLSSFTPGMHIGKGPVNTTINIRGIGSGLNKGFEQSVGMYIDGIYMGRARQFRSPFLDPQRVEVMRGPQGVLFGKNAIAGAISITSADPEIGEELGGHFRIEGAEYDTYVAEAVVSGSLSDSLGMRLVVKNRTSDGYIDDVHQGIEGPEVDELAGRLSVKWEPSERLSVTGKASFNNFETEGASGGLTSYRSISTLPPDLGGTLTNIIYGITGVVSPGIAGGGDYDIFRDDPGTWSNISNIDEEFTDTESENYSIHVNYDLENGWVIDSITGYSEYEWLDALDVDFLPIRLLMGSNGEDFDQFSQELRFSYLNGPPIEFIGGVYYENQNLFGSTDLNLDGTFNGLYADPLGVGAFGGGTSLISDLLWISGGDPTAPFLPFNQLNRASGFDQEAETLAVFAEVTAYLGDDVRLSLGARYSKEEKDAIAFGESGSNLLGDLGSPSNCIGFATTPFDCLTDIAVSALMSALPHNFGRSRTENHFDPSLKLQYDVKENAMLYFTAARGHKSGGFNSSVDIPIIDFSTPTDAFEFDEETVVSYEVGYKTTLAEGAVQLSLSAFYSEYSDLQVSFFKGTSFVVGNAAESELQGFEGDLRWAATDELEIGGSFAYLDFEFTDYPGAGCTAAQGVAFTLAGNPGSCTQDLSGENNAFAPEFSGNFYAVYTRAIARGLELQLAVDVNFKSEMYLDYDLDGLTEQSGFQKINARIALSSEKWELAVFGRNLTDELTHAFATDVPLATGSVSAWQEDPRIFGAGFTYFF